MNSVELMRGAIALARGNVRSGRGGPFAALVARDGNIVAEGTNLVTSTNDPSAHAEITALRAAGRALNNFLLAGCSIFATCEPCPMCLAAIFWARVDHIFFAATRHDAAAAGFDDEILYQKLGIANARYPLPAQQLLREEALICFRDWQAKPDKIPY